MDKVPLGQMTFRVYLALRLLVLAGAMAEAGKDGGDGLGVVKTTRKDNLVAVLLLAPSLPETISHCAPPPPEKNDSRGPRSRYIMRQIVRQIMRQTNG